MASRKGDVDLRFAQVSAPQLELWLAWQAIHSIVEIITEYITNRTSSGIEQQLPEDLIQQTGSGSGLPDHRPVDRASRQPPSEPVAW